MDQSIAAHGNYRETEESVRALATYAEAWALRELMLHELEQQHLAEDYLLRVEERLGRFDMIVMKRVN